MKNIFLTKYGYDMLQQNINKMTEKKLNINIINNPFQQNLNIHQQCFTG